MLRHAMFINEYGCYRYQSFAMFGCVMLILTQFEPVSSKVNHLRGTRFEEKRKQRF